MPDTSPASSSSSLLGTLMPPLAIASALAAPLLLLAPKSTPARLLKLVLHTAAYTTGLATVSIYGVLVSLVLSLGGPNLRYRINYIVARTFYHTVGPLVGWRFRVEGEEHLQALAEGDGGADGKSRTPAVIVGNHQSALDILYLGRIFPRFTSIMAKREIKNMPLLGWWMSLSGAVFINRKDRANAIKAFDQVGEDMKRKGISLWVFPEGTRSSSPEPSLLPFKKGAFHLAVQAQVPIVPVVCENYWHIVNFGGGKKGAAKGDGRGARFERGELGIKVLPPIPTAGLTASDVPALTERTYELMLTALRELSQRSTSLPAAQRVALASATDKPAPPQPRPEQREPASVAGVPSPSPGPQIVDEPVPASASSKGWSEGTEEDEEDEGAVVVKRP